MGVIVGTLIVFGAVYGFENIMYYGTKPERLQAEIDKLVAQNEGLRNAKDHITNIQTELVKGRNFLVYGKQKFKNGGYVYDSTPLANNNFNDCISKITDAIQNANNIIKDIDDTIIANNKKIRENRAKLNS